MYTYLNEITDFWMYNLPVLIQIAITRMEYIFCKIYPVREFKVCIMNVMLQELTQINESECYDSLMVLNTFYTENMHNNKS